MFCHSCFLKKDVKSRSSVVADCYESLLGAIYLDRGMLVARLFLANSMFVDDPDREKLVCLIFTLISFLQQHV